MADSEQLFEELKNPIQHLLLMTPESIEGVEFEAEKCASASKLTLELVRKIKALQIADGHHFELRTE